MKTVVLLIPLLCFGSLLYAQDTSNWIEDLTKPSKEFGSIQEARQLFQKGDINACYQSLIKAYEKDKDLPPAQFLYGIIYLERNRIKEGQNILEDAAVAYPDYPGIYVIFGNLALKDSRFLDATLQYDKALSILEKPNWKTYQKEAFLDQCYWGKALIAEKRKNWEEEASYLDKLINLHKKGGAIRQRLAVANFRAGKTKDTYSDMQKAKVENPNIEAPELTMARLYTEHNDEKEARQWVDKALTFNPKNENTRFQAAQLLYDIGDIEEAKKQALESQRLGFKANELKMLLGNIEREKKAYKEAEKIFSEIYQSEPTSFAASNLLVLVLIEQEDAEKSKKALQLAQMNAKLHPKNVNAMTTLGWVYFKLNNIDLAEKALNSAVALGNPTAETAYYIAHVLFKRNRLGDMKKWLELANTTSKRFIYKEKIEKWLAQLNKIPD